MNVLLSSAAFLGFTAVVIGAFGAHSLEDTLSPHALERYKTGVDYQFYHVAALVLIGTLSNSQNKHSNLLLYSGISFILGIILFSGSLYLFAITGISYFGMITPIGGLSLLAGWSLLFIFSIQIKKE